jgi:hypothetical protein
MSSRYGTLLTPAKWRDVLREAVIIAGTAASGLTTFMGAHQLVNSSPIVAALLTLFFQGGMYVAAHLASESSRGGRRPRTSALFMTWALLAFFSVYASALGMFEIQRDSISSDHERAAVVAQWQAAEKGVSDFRTDALAWLTKAKQDVSLKLNLERGREKAARAARQPYSPVAKQTLQSQLDAFNVAERRAQEVKLLSGSVPAKDADAVSAMDEAYASVSSAFSALPDEGKTQCPVPGRALAAAQPVELQKAFWAEVQAHSAPAIVILLVAFLMDFLPLMLRYATRPRLTLADKVFAARRAGHDLWSALSRPLTPATTCVCVAVEGHPELDINLEFAAGREALRLDDVRRNISVVAEAVSRQSDAPVRLARAMTSSGMELVPDMPLLGQLDDDLTIHLGFEPVTAEV